MNRLLVALILGAFVASLALPAPVFADEVRLAVPYRSQMDDSPYAAANCGPASLGMIFAGYGTNVPTSEIRRQVNKLQGTEGNYDSGTFIEVLAVLAERHGLEPRGLFSDGEDLRQWTFDDVRNYLDAGNPIIPQVWFRGLPGRRHRSYDGDHYIVITGYDDDEFIYHDPIDVDWSGSDRRMSSEEFDLAWRNSDFPYAALAIAGPATTPSLRVTPTPSPSPTPVPSPMPTPIPTSTMESVREEVLFVAIRPETPIADATEDVAWKPTMPIADASVQPFSPALKVDALTTESETQLNPLGLMTTAIPATASTGILIVFGLYIDARARRARQRRWYDRNVRRPLRSV